MEPFLSDHDVRDLVMAAVGGVFVFLMNRAVNRLDEDLQDKADKSEVTHLDDKLDTFIQASHDAHEQTRERLDMILNRLLDRK